MTGFVCPRCRDYCVRPFCPRCMIAGPGMEGWGSIVKSVKKAVKQTGKAISKAPSATSKFLKEQKKPLVAIGAIGAGAVLIATGVGAPVGLAVAGAGIGMSLGKGTGFGKPSAYVMRAAIGGAAGFAAGTAAAALFSSGGMSASGLFTTAGKLTAAGQALNQQAPQAIPMTAGLVEQGVDPTAAANMAYQAALDNPNMTDDEADQATDEMARQYKAGGGTMNEQIVALIKKNQVAFAVGSAGAVLLLALLLVRRSGGSRSATPGVAVA